MFDVSDRATGLTSLDDIDPADSIFAIAWQLGEEGTATMLAGDHAEVDVRYLSVRGLAQAEDGGSMWTQVHVAFPAEMIHSMLLTWMAQMKEPPPVAPPLEVEADDTEEQL